jgi:hypothetical protein
MASEADLIVFRVWPSYECKLSGIMRFYAICFSLSGGVGISDSTVRDMQYFSYNFLFMWCSLK